MMESTESNHKVMKTILFALAAAGVLCYGGSGINVHASAKSASLVSSRYMKTKTLKAKRNGNLYKTYRLSHVKSAVKAYQHKTFKANMSYTIKTVNGKKVKVYYVKSHTAKGYAPASLFKPTTAKASTKKTTVKKSTKKATPVAPKTTTKTPKTTTKKPAATKPAVTPKKTTPVAPKTSTKSDSDSDATDNTDYTLNVSEYKTAFLSYINAERAKRGIAPLTEDNDMNTLADYRANQLPTNFTHFNADGSMIALGVAKKLNVKSPTSENINQEYVNGYGWNDGTNSSIDNSKDVALADGYSYIYDDAEDNWGHRDSLLNKNYTKIGMGITYVKGQNLNYTVNDLY